MIGCTWFLIGLCAGGMIGFAWAGLRAVMKLSREIEEMYRIVKRLEREAGEA